MYLTPSLNQSQLASRAPSRSTNSESKSQNTNLEKATTTGDSFTALSSGVLSQIAVEAALQKGSTSTTVETTGVNNSTEQEALDKIVAEFQQRFTDAASNKEEFHALMQKTFGDNYNEAEAENIRQQTLAGDFSWMPEIRLVDASELNDVSGTQGAGEGLGAYSAESDTIFLNRELLARDPSKAEEILAEEVGHALDARLNTSDAAGDEGAIFSILLHGGDLSAEELAELQSENDTGVIIIDGKEVEVEYGFFKKLFRGIKKAFKSIGNAFKKLMESKLFNNLLMIASFIPIPLVQIVVRVINIAKAAYQVYQGIKHGSLSMVLSGVAGVAGGMAKLGKMVGATGQWVATAEKVASAAKQASVAYQAIAEKNWQAAAALSENYFGGDHDVTSFLKFAAKVDNAAKVLESGDALAIANLGATYGQHLTGEKGDAQLQTLQSRTGTMLNIRQTADNGDTLEAINMAATFGQDFTGEQGDAFLESIVTKTDEIQASIEKIEESAKGDDYGDTVGVFRTELDSLMDLPDSVNDSLMDLEDGVRDLQQSLEELEVKVEAKAEEIEEKIKNFSFNPSNNGATPGINPSAA